MGDVAEYGGMAFRLAEVTECVQARGQCAALCWLIGRDPSPVTGDKAVASRHVAEYESWLAVRVAVAAVDPGGVAGEWAGRVAAPLRPLVAGDGW
ncbi:MAG: hypothetical protein ACRDQX_12790, partial [Pseudonocardiaceae bacterium]